jgi:peptidoglycan/xylan/chitin deacetylase (PgdA/CDA1 family)
MDAARWASRTARGKGRRRPLVLTVGLIVALSLGAAFSVWMLTRTPGSTAAGQHDTGSAGAAQAGPPTGTVVSLTFNFGTASQYQFARPLLRQYGMQGSFYVTPDRIDAAEACCMTWQQAQQLYREGDEIGSFSADGVDLTVPWSPDPEQDYARKKQQVCRAHERLTQLGLDPRSFAYPAGAHVYEFPTLRRSLTDLVASCGYSSGRSIGGLPPEDGASSVSFVSLPPRDPYMLPSPAEGSGSPITLADLQQAVLAASGPGHWVPLVFGEVCHQEDPSYTSCMSTWRPVDDAVLAAFLSWLRDAGQPNGAPAGTAVRTVRQVMGAPPQPPLPAHRTFVSLTFDDGDATQVVAGDLLRAHRMHGTFYVNSGPVDAKDQAHMTWAQILRLHRDGNDIGGHTAAHVDLTDPGIPEAAKRDQVCQDNRRLKQMGLDPVSFAYPYGRLDAAAEEFVRSCGYRSGRSAGSVSPDGPVFAESVPPGDPFSTMALDGPAGPAVEGGSTGAPAPLTLDYLQRAVVSAADNGGGWVQVVLHHVCVPGSAEFAACMSGEAPIEASTFGAFLDWLQHGAPDGTKVRTVRQVMSATP